MTRVLYGYYGASRVVPCKLHAHVNEVSFEREELALLMVFTVAAVKEPPATSDSRSKENDDVNVC